MTTNGGGFAAGAGPMTVNMGGDLRTLSWANTAGTNLCGPLKFGSLSAANVTTFLNPINLNGGTRTIQVANNSATNADYAVVSSVISNSSGTYGINKTGDGLLILSGDNTFNGPTTVAGGALQAEFGLGIPGLLNLNGGVLQGSITDAAAVTFNYSVGTTSGKFQWNTGGGGFSAGAGPLTVNVGGSVTPAALVWGSTVGTNLVGPLKLGSATSMNTTTLQNPLDFNGANRTIDVDDNLATSADFSTLSGVLSNSTGTAGFQKTGSGLLVLAAANTYNGTTTLAGGSLQADQGVGLPDASLLSFNGGVFQNASAATFSRTLGTVSGNVQWEAGGGGFAAGGGALTVNIGGNATPSTLVWGSTVGTNLVGTLLFGSSSAQYTTTFQNSFDLGGADRVIQLQDNPNSTGDNVVLSGNLTGTGGLTIAGTGDLRFAGASNTYTGATTVSCGTLDLATTTGPAIPHDLNIVSSGSVPTQVRVQAAGQIASTANIAFGGASAEARLLLLGRSLTVAGISDSSGLGVIENTQDQTASNVTLVVNNSTNCSFNGTLRNTATGSGTLMLAKTGTGTLTLSGANIAHTGGTSVLGGRLVLQDTTNAAFLGTNIANNAAVEFNLNSADIAYAKTISGSGSLTKSGARTLTLEGAGIGCYGGTTVTAGKLILKDTSNSTFLSRGIVNNAAVEINTAAVNLTLSGAISGSGSLTHTGGYTLTLSGSTGNTYTGATTHSQGVLILNKTSGYAIPGDLNFYAAGDSAWIYLYQNNQFSPNTVINFQGGYWPHLVLYGHSTTVAGISDPYGSAVIESTQSQSVAALSTLTINNENDCYYAGHIRNTADGSGTLAIVKGGAGKLTIAGDVCGGYTGGLTVNAGTLDYSGGALPAAPYTLNGGTLDIGARSQSIGLFRLAGGTLAGTGTLTSSSVYDIQAGTVNAVLAGTVGLNKTTSGAATVNAPAYTGATTVSLGTLQFTGSLPTGAYTASGGVLNIGALSQTIGLLKLNGGTINGTGTLTSSSTYDIQSGTVNAVLAGAVGLSKSTSNTAVLGGANAYTGTTTVALGALQADSGVGLPAASFLSLNGGVFQSNTAATFTRGLAASGANSFQWLSGGGGFAAGGCPLSVNIGGGTPLVWGSTAGANLVGTLKFGSTTAAYATTFQNAIDLGGTTRSIQVDDNVNSTADLAVIAGVISNSAANSAGLNKTGAGTLVLAADNTYTGTTFASSGTLQIGNGGTTGSVAGSILDNATVVFNRSNDVVFGGAITGAGTLVKNGPAKLTLAANNSFSGTTTVNSGILEIGNGGTVGSIAGNIADNATLAFNRTDDVAYAGNIAGVGNVVKKGVGTLVLTGTSTYGGGTTIDAGTLQVGGNGTTGSIAGNVVNNATLAFNRTDDVAFAGAVQGTGSLVKNTANTLTLTAANTYAGGTTINAGTLQIGNGGNAGSIVGNVANNATLAFDRADNAAFDGVVSGPGGLVQKGGGSLILNAASDYTGPTRILSGALTLTATGQIDPQSEIGNNALLVIADGAHTLGDIAGTGSLLVGDTSVLTATSIVLDTLVIGGDYTAYATPTPPPTAVPEPAAIFLLLAALLALPMIKKRRK
jgi:autotransporter-associated beta strand protein